MRVKALPTAPTPMVALKTLVAACGSQAAAAKHLGISGPYLHDILRGQRAFSKRVLAALGFEVVIRPRREV